MRRWKTIAFLVAALAPAGAFADVPPPPGYVEGCTIEKQCAPSEEGTSCGAWHGERDKCKKLHAADGFVYKCSTRGASVWTEVYCRAKKK